MSRISCIVVAAGRGLRAGQSIPKQYSKIAGIPMLCHTLHSLLDHSDISEIIPVIHPDDAALFADALQYCQDARILAPVHGGETRSASVRAGLDAVSGDFVLIHDAARPFLPLDAINRLIESLKTTDAAFLALPVVDALWQVDQSLSPVARNGLWRAQTPQAFKTSLIKSAYEIAGNGTDDVAIAVAAGHNPTPVLGDEKNFKITHPQDFHRAEAMLKGSMDIRVGNGFDVHALGAGDHVILNGIQIPHDQGLIGHSDADVAMHAITDAILGAMAMGDIGTHFPPSDDQWNGAASDIFLRDAVTLACKAGFRIGNIDCTIICETPKIGPHADAMRKNLAEITGVSLDRVSVKATTSEKLGFTGRSEGIAAQASVTMVSK